MNTNQLLEKAAEKLQETKIQFEEDKKRLEELTGERGLILASELIESKPDQKEKIEKLSRAITLLKTTIEDTSPIINGLKAKLLGLKAQKEREDLQQARDDQDKLELEMNKTSLKLIPLLEKANSLNNELRRNWKSWAELTAMTGKAMADKKISLGSEEMLQLVCGTILSEWQGKGHRVRDFYNRIKL